jgi:hypothetical protein
MSKHRVRDALVIEEEINSLLDQLQKHRDSFDEEVCEKVLQ